MFTKMWVANIEAHLTFVYNITVNKCLTQFHININTELLDICINLYKFIIVYTIINFHVINDYISWE